RRVQELAADLHAGEQLICRAAALRVREVPEGLPAPPAGEQERPRPMPGAHEGLPMRFTLDHSEGASFAASAMEMRWLTEPFTPGPGRVWMRMRLPLLDGRTASPLAQLTATADFGNGVSAVLPF